jgi:hypothetical protein
MHKSAVNWLDKPLRGKFPGSLEEPPERVRIRGMEFIRTKGAPRHGAVLQYRQDITHDSAHLYVTPEGKYVIDHRDKVSPEHSVMQHFIQDVVPSLPKLIREKTAEADKHMFRAFAERVLEHAASEDDEYRTFMSRPRVDRPPRAAYARPPLPEKESEKLSAIKQALIERLVRLGATPVEQLPGVRRFVKKTPTLFMKSRSPQELAQLEKGVTRAVRKVEAPLERKLNTSTASWSPGPKKLVRKAGRMLIRNPEQIPLAAVPVPGVGPVVAASKRALERGIDRFAT